MELDSYFRGDILALNSSSSRTKMEAMFTFLWREQSHDSVNTFVNVNLLSLMCFSSLLRSLFLVHFPLIAIVIKCIIIINHSLQRYLTADLYLEHPLLTTARVVPVHQWLWCSWSRGHCFWSQACPVCTGTTRNPSFSLQWKSDESTKHHLTEMLIVINWRYWQAGKIQACVWMFKVASCKRPSLKFARFSQKRSDTF